MPHADAAQIIYVEALGKAGAYGVGYERAITRRLALGAAVSLAVIREQQLATVAPYVHGTLAMRGKHAAFVEVGPTLAYSRVPSPSMHWNGASDVGGGGFVSAGWERRSRHTVMRFALSVVAGEGGLAPWGGFAIGLAP